MVEFAWGGSREISRVPRFYFHSVSAQHSISDDQGSDLPSLRSAHMHALGLIARSIRSRDQADKERWTVQITDDTGHLLLTVMFPFPGIRLPALEEPPAASTRAAGQLRPRDTPAFLRAYAAALRDIDARLEHRTPLARQTSPCSHDGGQTDPAPSS